MRRIAITVSVLLCGMGLFSTEAMAQRFCKPNSHWSRSQGRCVCNPGYTKYRYGQYGWMCRYTAVNVNRRCKPNSHYNYRTLRCHCNPGYDLIYYSATNWYCKQKKKLCRANSHFNPYTGLCNCNAGYRMVRYTATNWYCAAQTRCPENATRNSLGHCGCRTGYYKTWVGDSWFCRPGACRPNSYFRGGYCYCNPGFTKVKYSEENWYCVPRSNYHTDRNQRDDGTWACNPGWQMFRYGPGVWNCGKKSPKCKPNSHMRANGLCFCDPGFKVYESGTPRWYCAYPF
ncbi:MAG: hypothetical protein KC609_03970 [Myxococcales bacterium]|nr:hypothetical protein [Myxococcales bacterium]